MMSSRRSAGAGGVETDSSARGPTAVVASDDARLSTRVRHQRPAFPPDLHPPRPPRAAGTPRSPTRAGRLSELASGGTSGRTPTPARQNSPNAASQARTARDQPMRPLRGWAGPSLGSGRPARRCWPVAPSSGLTNISGGQRRASRVVAARLALHPAPLHFLAAARARPPLVPGHEPDDREDEEAQEPEPRRSSRHRSRFRRQSSSSPSRRDRSSAVDSLAQSFAFCALFARAMAQTNMSADQDRIAQVNLRHLRRPPCGAVGRWPSAT
jgi:hypothetical protein